MPFTKVAYGAIDRGVRSLYELDKSLRVIAGVGSLQDIVFTLIQVAESQGWIVDLLRAARESNFN